MKIFSMPALSSFGMSSAGMMPPPNTRIVAGAALAELLDDPREQRHVRARVAREPDRVGVLLDRGLGDLLGRLMQPGVDDLEARVAERAGHHLRAAVVPVEPGLRDDHSVRLGHRAASLTNAQVAARNTCVGGCFP